MANDKLEILLSVNDKLSPELRKAKKSVDDFTGKSKRSFAEMAVKAAAVVAAITAIAKAASALIKAADTVEQVKIKLEVLLGTVEEGNRLFNSMRELASGVVQQFEEIMQASASLAGVVKGGSREIEELMPVILDISAATGLGVQETTSQIIRMYSAGAAAADLFRERGISSALGFKAGATVSAKETMDIILQQWEDGTGKFVGANDRLADSWTGTVSILKDAWFNFTSAVGEALIENEAIKAGLTGLTDGLNAVGDALRGIGETDQLEAVQRQLEQFRAMPEFIKDRAESQARFNELLEMERQLKEQILIQDSQAVEFARQKADEQKRQAEELIGSIEKEAKKAALALNRAFSDPLADFISGSKSAKEAAASLGQSLVKMVADLAAQWVIAHTIGRALSKAAVGQAVIEAKILEAAWRPPAIFAAIATGGAATAAGTASIIASMGTIKALSLAMSNAVPQLAEGGIVTKPTLAMVGEAGPEAVVPLGKGGGIGGITINIHEANLSSREDVGDLAEELGFEIERNLRIA